MYQALYRKYRPLIFDDVVGQEHITKVLRRQVEEHKTSHAYLFTGTRGTGKTTCAKILSRAVNCIQPIDGNPCNICTGCKGILSGTVLDVTEIDAASNNGVDNIRQLREEANYIPAEVTIRVYIIDEVHMLSPSAFNALLKTLEEPPKNVLFILATTEVHKIPATILSRCQRFDFGRIGIKDISGYLATVCQSENVNVGDDSLELIADCGDGSMRDALSILDRCIGASTADDKPLDVDLVRNICGISGNKQVLQLIRLAINNDVASALECFQELYNGGRDMASLCDQLAFAYRNILVVKTAKKPQSLLEMTEQDLLETEGLAALSTLEDIVSSIDTIMDTHNKISKADDSRILMEVMIVRLASPKLKRDDGAILARVALLEAGVGVKNTIPTPEKKRTISIETTDFISKSDVNISEKASISKDDKNETTPIEELYQKAKEETPKLQKNNSSKPPLFWSDVIDRLKLINPMLYAHLFRAKPFYSNNTLEIYISDFDKILLEKGENKNVICDLVKAVTGEEISIIFRTNEKNINLLKNNGNFDELAAIAEDFK